MMIAFFMAMHLVMLKHSLQGELCEKSQLREAVLFDLVRSIETLTSPSTRPEQPLCLGVFGLGRSIRQGVASTGARQTYIEDFTGFLLG
jgi:hypothetical protein